MRSFGPLRDGCWHGWLPPTRTSFGNRLRNGMRPACCGWRSAATTHSGVGVNSRQAICGASFGVSNWSTGAGLGAAIGLRSATSPSARIRKRAHSGIDDVFAIPPPGPGTSRLATDTPIRGGSGGATGAESPHPHVGHGQIHVRARPYARWASTAIAETGRPSSWSPRRVRGGCRGLGLSIPDAHRIVSMVHVALDAPFPRQVERRSDASCVSRTTSRRSSGRSGRRCVRR